MWPGCQNCGAAVPEINDRYCGGAVCIKKNIPTINSTHKPHTKKKLNREIIKARRKKGRR